MGTPVTTTDPARLRARTRAAIVVCVALPALSGVVAACTLFTDLDGLSGSDAASDSGSDIAVDAAAPDAATDSSFCAKNPQATFCTSFDGPMAVALSGWSDENLMGSGGIGLDTSTFLSAPRSFRASLAAEDAGTITTGRLELDLDKATRRTRFSFAVQMDAPSLAQSEVLSIAEILCLNGTKFDGAWIHWHAVGSQAVLSVVIGDVFNDILVTPTSFTHFQIDATWGTSPAVVVSVEGMQVLSKPLTTNCPGATGGFELVLGLAASRGIRAPISALYDDVLYERDPP